MGIVEAEGHVGSPVEALEVGEVGCTRVLISNGNRAENAARLNEVAIHLQGAGQDWIETGDGSALP